MWSEEVYRGHLPVIPCLKMTAVCSSETLLPLYQTVRCQDPENNNINLYCCGNLELQFYVSLNVKRVGCGEDQGRWLLKADASFSNAVDHSVRLSGVFIFRVLCNNTFLYTFKAGKRAIAMKSKGN